MMKKLTIVERLLFCMKRNDGHGRCVKKIKVFHCIYMFRTQNCY